MGQRLLKERICNLVLKMFSSFACTLVVVTLSNNDNIILKNLNFFFNHHICQFLIGFKEPLDQLKLHNQLLNLA